MKLKALVSFCGKVSVGKGQEFFCSEEMAADLTRARFAVEVGSEGEPDNAAGNSSADKSRKRVSRKK